MEYFLLEFPAVEAQTFYKNSSLANRNLLFLHAHTDMNCFASTEILAKHTFFSFFNHFIVAYHSSASSVCLLETSILVPSHQHKMRMNKAIAACVVFPVLNLFTGSICLELGLQLFMQQTRKQSGNWLIVFSL